MLTVSVVKEKKKKKSWIDFFFLSFKTNHKKIMVCWSVCSSCLSWHGLNSSIVQCVTVYGRYSWDILCFSYLLCSGLCNTIQALNDLNDLVLYLYVLKFHLKYYLIDILYCISISFSCCYNCSFLDQLKFCKISYLFR